MGKKGWHCPDEISLKEKRREHQRMIIKRKRNRRKQAGGKNQAHAWGWVRPSPCEKKERKKKRKKTFVFAPGELWGKKIEEERRGKKRSSYRSSGRGGEPCGKKKRTRYCLFFVCCK